MTTVSIGKTQTEHVLVSPRNTQHFDELRFWPLIRVEPVILHVNLSCPSRTTQFEIKTLCLLGRVDTTSNTFSENTIESEQIKMRIRRGQIVISISILLLLASLLTTLSAQADSKSSEVIFHCDFESEKWWDEWGLRDSPQRVDTLEKDPRREFKSHDGKALRIRIDQGGHYGVSLQYQFAKRLGSEPEEIYFRYYLRLGSD